MSIRILPDSEIKQAASSFHTPTLLFSNPKNLYYRRAKRLRQLAENNPFGDYLEFIAHLVDVQLDLLQAKPIADATAQISAYIEQNQGEKPLNAKKWKRSSEWRELLFALIEKFKPYCNEQILATLEWLEKASTNELEELAEHILHERYEMVGADKAVFIWAALSLYWSQLALQLPRNIVAEAGSERHTCPVCDASPVASVIQLGDTQGLRYLHCSLCESEWHMVRTKCSNCDQSRDLNYWSLDIAEAVKAESCGDCGSYLKIMSQEKDPHIEPVADDLATLFLDAEMEQKDFARSALNPFLFQVE